MRQELTNSSPKWKLQIRARYIRLLPAIGLAGLVWAQGALAANPPVFVSTAGGTIDAGINGLSHPVLTLSVTAAEALANTGQHFVLVGNSAGAVDVTTGGVDGFTLMSGQSLSSFNGGNVIGDGNGNDISSFDVTVANSNRGAIRVISSFGGGSISNMSVSTVGDAAAIAEINPAIEIVNASSPLALSNLSIDNGDAVAVLLDTNSGNVALVNVDLVDLDMSGPNSGTALEISGASHPGHITVDSDSDLGNTTGTVIAADVTDNILHLDASAAQIVSANNVGNVIDIAGLSAGSLIALGQVSVDGAIGPRVINIDNVTGGEISLHDVNITNFGDQPSDKAIEFTGLGAAVSIGELSFMAITGSPLVIDWGEHVVDTFDSDNGGWVSFQNGGAPVVHLPSGGNPGGYISVVDETVGWAYLQAPAAYLAHSAYGGELSFDLFAYTDDPDNYPLLHTVRVGIEGAGLTLINEASLPTTNWMNYAFSLEETSGWRKFSDLAQDYDDAAPIPTEFEMTVILANLTGLYIATEYTNGYLAIGRIDETNLDNVRLRTP